jgi:hypothetical protein
MHFPCQNSLIISLVKTPRKIFMIELLGDLKVSSTFHLNPIGELVVYNEKFQPQ